MYEPLKKPLAQLTAKYFREARILQQNIFERIQYIQVLEDHKRSKILPKCFYYMSQPQVPASGESIFMETFNEIQEKETVDTLNLLIETNEDNLVPLKSGLESFSACIYKETTSYLNQFMNVSDGIGPDHFSVLLK